jgi:hypothetical protein
MSRTARERSFDTVRITAWIYAVLFGLFAPITAFDVLKGLRTDVFFVLWAGWTACAVAAASAAYRKRVGYYFCAVFSVFILFAPPIGTLLGWNMLRALRRNRDRFSRRARTA